LGLKRLAAITRKDTRLQLQFVANTDHSIHAGLVAVEAMARRFDLWNKVRQLSCLDPRKDKQCGLRAGGDRRPVDLCAVLRRGLSVRQRGAQ
jgi:hypothetical protein